MPEPTPDPDLDRTRRVALVAVGAGVVITALKLGLFYVTGSVAVLSDALESVVNIAAAILMLYALWYANRPADREHPYGHGKFEFLVVGLEGWLILTAGVLIAFQAVKRLITPREIAHLEWGIVGLAVLGVVTLALGVYVWRSGRKYQSDVLIADGKHLITDSVSTWAVFLGLLLVRWTGEPRLDPVVAIVVAACILWISWRMLWQSVHGLMDRQDPETDRRIRTILDEEVAGGGIRGYHKVRHRHNGPFCWVDMHIQLDADLSVARAHAVASRIEGRIERDLGQANATAHIEPATAAHLNDPTGSP